jgi:hypothetical protein
VIIRAKLACINPDEPETGEDLAVGDPRADVDVTAGSAVLSTNVKLFMVANCLLALDSRVDHADEKAETNEDGTEAGAVTW